MKKLLVVLLLLIPASLSVGQRFDVHKSGVDAVYMSYQPVDHGLGIKADYHIWKIGLYNSLTYGNKGLYKIYQLGDHTKFTAGVLVPIKDLRAEYHYCLQAGVNYHLLDGSVNDDPIVNPKIFRPWSYELGICMYVGGFALSMRTDIRRWEPGVDVGINF